MGRRIATVVAGIMLVAGAVLLAYPFANEALYRAETSSMRQGFSERVAASQGAAAGEAAEEAAGAARPIDAEGLYAYLKAENERLLEEEQKDLKDAWSYEQPNVDLSAWGIEDNVIGFLRVPSIGAVLPVRLGANADQMAVGAVHLTQTSFPIGGEGTNSVIAAHRGMNNGLAMFSDLPSVQAGDEVIIENFRETLEYRVVDTQVIMPTDVSKIRIQEGRDMVTLITCHPLGHNYQRFAVYAERVK